VLVLEQVDAGAAGQMGEFRLENVDRHASTVMCRS
jgi:hypothetical protein